MPKLDFSKMMAIWNAHRPEVRQAFDEYWTCTVEPIHPGWRDTPAGQASNFHAWQAWTAQQVIIDELNGHGSKTE